MRTIFQGDERTKQNIIISTHALKIKLQIKCELTIHLNWLRFFFFFSFWCGRAVILKVKCFDI